MRFTGSAKLSSLENRGEPMAGYAGKPTPQRLFAKMFPFAKIAKIFPRENLGEFTETFLCEA